MNLPYDSRAELFAFAGRLEEAGESYAQALEKDPDFLAALSGAAEIKLWQGDVAEAERMFQKNAGHSNKRMRSGARLNRVKVALYQGRLREAQERTELALQTSAVEFGDGTIKTSARLWQSLLETVGRLTGRTELFDSAYTMAEEYHLELLADTELDTLSLKSRLSSNSQRLATLAAFRGEFDKAYKHLNEYSKSTDTNAYMNRINMSLVRRIVEFEQGNYEKALEKLEWMVTENTEGVFPALYFVGVSYLSVGRVAEAVETLERASTRYDGIRFFVFPTESVLVHYELGKAYEASGWKKKAVEQYEKFLNIWRDADEGILALKDARERLAKLKSL
ncbi:tetratricopeptide repeat protein [bacterium AH-315-F03]|nr:tetratricopeptide repeat protein [bacterium AH-315-F03]